MKSPAFRRKKSTAKRSRSDGLVAHALLEDGEVPESSLDVSWVESGSGSFEYVHAAEKSAAYVVVRGKAWTRVGDEGAEAAEDDLFHVPAGLPHAIANASESEPLVYLKVRSPDARRLNGR